MLFFLLHIHDSSLQSDVRNERRRLMVQLQMGRDRFGSVFGPLTVRGHQLCSPLFHLWISHRHSEQQNSAESYHLLIGLHL